MPKVRFLVSVKVYGKSHAHTLNSADPLSAVHAPLDHTWIARLSELNPILNGRVETVPNTDPTTMRGAAEAVLASIAGLRWRILAGGPDPIGSIWKKDHWARPLGGEIAYGFPLEYDAVPFDLGMVKQGEQVPPAPYYQVGAVGLLVVQHDSEIEGES